MAMNPRCLICTNPATRVAVQELRAKGASIRDIEAKVQRSRSSIARHLKHTEKTSVAFEGSERRRKSQPRRRRDAERCPSCGTSFGDADPKALIQRAERALHFGEAIVMRAVEENDDRLALQALDRVRTSLEQLMKVHGLLHPDGAQDNRKMLNIFGNVPLDDVRKILSALPAAGELTAP